MSTDTEFHFSGVLRQPRNVPRIRFCLGADQAMATTSSFVLRAIIRKKASTPRTCLVSGSRRIAGTLILTSPKELISPGYQGSKTPGMCSRHVPYL